MSKEQPEFEDGKQVEDYVAELNEISDNLAIEPDKFPEGQPLENVAEVIEKPIKKKPSVSSTATGINPTPQYPPAKPSNTETVIQVNSNIAPPAQVTMPPAIIPDAQPSNIVEHTPSLPLEKPSTTEASQLPQQQAPVFRGIDAYIEETAEAIGKNAKETFRKNAYTNLFAVINGQVGLVPLQQEQQEPQPEPEPNPLLELQQIELALKEPKNRSVFKQLIERKCQLLRIPFDESMLQQPIAPIVETEPQPPVSSKPAEKKQEKPKRSGMSKLKLIGLSVSLALVATVAVILAIAMLTH
jgi:hypothetical protein